MVYNFLVVNSDNILPPTTSTGVDQPSGDGISAAGTPIRYYHVLTVGIICFLLGAILSFIATMHCHRLAFGTPEGGATSASVAVASVVASGAVGGCGEKSIANGNGAVIMATPFDDDDDDVDIGSSASAFYRFPTGVRRLVGTRAPSTGGDSSSYAGGCDGSTRTATTSSQAALMDFRQYYHRTNSSSVYSRTGDRI